MGALAGVRGQAAVENLMAYGWVVLALMLAAVFIWQTNTLNVHANTGASATGFSHVKPLLETTHYQAGDGNFRVAFKNTAGGAIDLTSGAVTAGEAECTVEPSQVEQDGNFTIMCGIAAEPDARLGETYSLNVSITYDLLAGGKTNRRTESGVIRGPKAQ